MFVYLISEYLVFCGKFVTTVAQADAEYIKKSNSGNEYAEDIR